MTPITSILVATDFSVAANIAVRRAALIAAQHDARMTLLNVVDPSTFRPLRGWVSKSTAIDFKVAQAHVALGGFAAEIAGRHDVHVRTAVQIGDALEHVRQMMEDADLLVVGASSADPLKDFLFGTPTERLLRLLRRPVLVAKQPLEGPYRRVLVPVDFTESSEAAVRTALDLAPFAAIHLIHALSGHPLTRLRADVPEAVIREYEARDRQRGVRRLRSMVASLDHARLHICADHGDPAHLTLAKQKRIVADLVVMGKKGQSTVSDFLLGSVVNRVMSNTPCDVLVIPKASVPRLIAQPERRDGFSSSAKACPLIARPATPRRCGLVQPLTQAAATLGTGSGGPADDHRGRAAA
ncbi:universal stress protein [Caldimonas brevitalea]|uniref:UspA domain-containing protein n=1 Tax=Caldimonas brevitalea TaxID=413882 RepID=A0A0G3BS49_9BURK|nr:universal stress protein [Caldimonas brevitalea]AKJ30778.1 hypothetical protein AAW51_4087 [Caldimonas brevitalea]